MNKTTMLKWARKEKGLSQRAVGDAVGLNHNTIYKLESNSEAWNSLKDSTKEKLNNFFNGTKYWEPLEVGTSKSSVEDFIDVDPTYEAVETKPALVERKVIHKDTCVEPNDVKALTLIEFAYEGLNESKTHEDFVANINLMKKILAKFY